MAYRQPATHARKFPTEVAGLGCGPRKQEAGRGEKEVRPQHYGVPMQTDMPQTRDDQSTRYRAKRQASNVRKARLRRRRESDCWYSGTVRAAYRTRAVELFLLSPEQVIQLRSVYHNNTRFVKIRAIQQSTHSPFDPRSPRSSR